MTDSELTKLGANKDKTAALYRIWLLVILVAAVVLVSMGYIYYAGRQMAAVHAPLIDAALEIKLEATMAHLWFEEAISGDQTVTMGDVLKHLDKADWYTNVMLEGGTNEEGRFYPLSDSQAREDIAEIRKKLVEFKKVAIERSEATDSAGVGSPVDQRFDAIFKDLIDQADVVETDLQRVMALDLRRFAKVQVALMTSCVLLTVAVGIAFERFVRKQLHDEQKLLMANQQLDAANQQLMAGEQQLKASNQQLQSEIIERQGVQKSLTGLNEELEQTIEKLERSNEELQDFAYIASHDLREPLRKISSFGDLLKDSVQDTLGEDDRENLEFMIDGANRMSQMIEAMLVYSRVNTRDIVLNPVDLNEIIEQFRQVELAALLEETNGTIEVPQPLPRILADTVLIRQLMQNLVVNGIKYQEEGVVPCVVITAKQIDGDRVKIEIKDNGIGIKEDLHEAIFKMFKRVHSRQKYEGTGIGLAVCKKIAERHDSQITVDSREGEGSVFSFNLAAAAEPISVS